MSYLGRSAKLSLKAQEKVSFLATAGQTSKTGLSYTPNFIEVYVNGVLLTDTTDFTATNGNSITFTVALLVNDEVTVVSLKTFTVADHYSKTQADVLLDAKAPLANPVFTGNVLVGKSALATNTVGHELKPQGSAVHTTDGISPLYLNRKSTDGDIAVFRKDNTTVGSIGSYTGDNLTIGTGAVGVRFDVGLSDIIPHNVTTNVNQDATINLGHSEVRFSDLYLSGGVYLGGTGAANKLDDYESGTCTLTTADAVTGGTTGITTTGYYTKVGRLVTIYASLSNITTTGMTAANSLRLQGLPFLSENTISVLGTCKVDNVSFQSTRTYAWCTVSKNASYMSFQQGGNGISDTNIDVSDINSGISDIQFSITYSAA